MTLSHYTDSLLIQYMSGVVRDQARIDEYGEYFTPDAVVQHMLAVIDSMDPKMFQDLDQPFLDPTCGDGQFLALVLLRKLEYIASVNNGAVPYDEFKTALASIYGVEYHADNAALCRRRLLCGHTEPELVAIVEHNIVCDDATTCEYKFDGTTSRDYQRLFEGL